VHVTLGAVRGPQELINDPLLQELGFGASEIDGLRASSAIPKAKERAA